MSWSEIIGQPQGRAPRAGALVHIHTHFTLSHSDHEFGRAVARRPKPSNCAPTAAARTLGKNVNGFFQKLQIACSSDATPRTGHDSTALDILYSVQLF